MIRQLSGLKYSNSKLLKTGRFSELVLSLTFSQAIKRLFDVVLSFLGLIILAPFFFYIARLVQRDSNGPAFYWGWRAGVGGKPFRMLKFRTMYEQEQSYCGPRVTCKQDDRITPIG